MGIEEIRELQNKLQRESNQLVNKIMDLENMLFSREQVEKITNSQLNLLDIQLN